MSNASEAAIVPIPHFAKLVRTVTPERAADVDKLRAILNAGGHDADPVHIEMAYSAWSLKATSKPWHPIGYRKDADHYAVLLECLSRASQVNDLPPVEAKPVTTSADEPRASVEPSVEPSEPPKAEPEKEQAHDAPSQKQDDARTRADEAPVATPERAASGVSGLQGGRADGGGGRRR